MKLLLISLLALVSLTSVSSQVTLVQSGQGLLKPSETLKLTCAVSGVSITDGCCWWHWVRQRPGRAWEWLGLIKNDGSVVYSQSFPSRLTVSRDTAKNSYYLQLGSMTNEDTAMYYCTRGLRDYWGQGTMVTVTTASATAPSVFPLTSCTGEVTTPQVTFGCLAKGYFPEPVTVTWSPNVGSSGVRTYPSVLQPSSSLYSLSSQVTVPASSWESDTYSCTVQHQPTSSSISKEIPKPIPIKPQVEVFYNCNSQSEVELVCLISGFYPERVDVDWLVNGERRAGNTEPPTKDADGRNFSTRSNLSVPQGEWLAGKTYTCQVYHPGTKTTTQAHARKCQG